MKRTLLALAAATTLALTACSSPTAAPEPSTAHSPVSVATKSAEATPAAVKKAPIKMPATPAKNPGAKQHMFYTYLNELKTDPATTPDWTTLVQGAKDNGNTLELYTTIPANAFMEEAGREDWDIDSLCIGASYYVTKMGDAGKKVYDQIVVMGDNNQPIELCNLHATFADTDVSED